MIGYKIIFNKITNSKEKIYRSTFYVPKIINKESCYGKDFLILDYQLQIYNSNRKFVEIESLTISETKNSIIQKQQLVDILYDFAFISLETLQETVRRFEQGTSKLMNFLELDQLKLCKFFLNQQVLYKIQIIFQKISSIPKDRNKTPYGIIKSIIQQGIDKQNFRKVFSNFQIKLQEQLLQKQSGFNNYQQFSQQYLSFKQVDNLSQILLKQIQYKIKRDQIPLRNKKVRKISKYKEIKVIQQLQRIFNGRAARCLQTLKQLYAFTKIKIYS